MLQDTIKMTGDLKIVLTDENGQIKHEQEVKNLVVTVGKNFIASRIKDATATASEAKTSPGAIKKLPAASPGACSMSATCPGGCPS